MSYKDYIPKLTGSKLNPQLGNNSAAFGRYLQIGQLVQGTAQITFGNSGTSSGSGLYQISLPVKGRSNKGNPVIGQGWIFHRQLGEMGNKFRIVVVELDESGENALLRLDSIPALGSETPWQWDEDDTISISFNYEAADGQ